MWKVVWVDEDDEDDDDDVIIVGLTSSVVFPPATLTRTRPSVPPVMWTYSPGPYPTIGPEDGPSPPLPPPPLGYPPSITGRRGAPKPTCKPGQNCGKPCIFNCDGRGGGCKGICGCVGPACPGSSEDHNRVGPGCKGRGGDEGDNSDEDCDVETVTDFWVSCGASSTSCTSKCEPEYARSLSSLDGWPGEGGYGWSGANNGSFSQLLQVPSSADAQPCHRQLRRRAELAQRKPSLRQTCSGMAGLLTAACVVWVSQPYLRRRPAAGHG